MNTLTKILGKLGATLCALATIQQAARAVTVDFTGLPGERNSTLSSTTTLADNNYLRVGTFDSSFNIAANINNLSALDGAFTEIAAVQIATISLEGGRFTGTGSTTNAAQFGERIHMWFFKTSDDLPPTAGFGTVQEHGVFTNASMTNWLVPDPSDVPASTLINSGEVATAFGLAAVVGSATTGSLQLSPIPEPSVALLTLSGILGLLFRRNRKASHGRDGQECPSSEEFYPQQRRTGISARLACIAAVLLAVALQTEKTLAIATIDYAGQIGQRNLIDSQGESLAGGEVQVGMLEENFDPESEVGSLTRLSEAFTVLGSTPVRSIHGDPGRFGGTAEFTEPGLAGRKLYVLVLSTLDGGDAWSDNGNVVEFGLFSSSDAKWKVPTGSARPPSNSIVIHSSQIDEAFGGAAILQNSLQIASATLPTVDYGTWAVSTFLDGTPEDPMLPDADPDSDGVSNLLEQLSGSNPLEQNALPYSFTFDGEELVFTFTQSTAVPNGAGYLEISSDLSNWQPAPVQSRTIDQQGEVSQITLTVVPETTPQYVRLSVRSAN